MISEWLKEYDPQTVLEKEQALREILQELTLTGLGESGFFKEAAFYGGTALRIFHQLPRFSEDMDFTLLKSDPDFSLQPFIRGVTDQFKALGIDVTIIEKRKTKQSRIDSAFLKPDTVWKEFILNEVPLTGKPTLRPDIKIKIEVDTDPPLGFETEENLMLRPFSTYIKCVRLPDLFAGKMHALLFRKWINRVKGRDWFDLEWYIRNRISINLEHFCQRARQTGDWSAGKITKPELLKILNARISEVDFDKVREDVVKFVPDAKVLQIWSEKYFQDLMKHLTTV